MFQQAKTSVEVCTKHPKSPAFSTQNIRFSTEKRWNRPKKAWNHLQKEPDCRTLVHCKQTILPACDKTKNRNENHPTERKRRESDTEHDRLRHLPTENQNGDQNPARIHFPPATAILLARQALQRGRPTAQSTPGSRIPQDERCLPDENLQRHRGTDRRPAFRQVRNSPCETSCLGTAPDAARIHRFQRTDCKDLDYLHPSEQFAAGQTGRSRGVPRPCLPPCREMLPAPTAFRHSAERAQAGTVLPPLLRPRSHVPPGLHTVLSCTARLHARRNHLSGSPARREVTPDARRAGI